MFSNVLNIYRGVVQLFNLVKQQQRTVEKKLKNIGPSILKQDKVLESLDKKSFIDSIDHRKVSHLQSLKHVLGKNFKIRIIFFSSKMMKLVGMFSVMTLWVDLKLKIGTNKQKMKVKMMASMFKSNNYYVKIYLI